jgi:hypothetical protein
MPRTVLHRFAENLFHGILANAIYAIVFGVTMAIIARYAPAWSHPALFGLAASLLGLCILLALRAIRNLPPTTETINSDNIEENVRTWLYNTNLTVKRDPTPETYFRFLVTTDGDKKIFVGRPKSDWSDYLVFRSDLVTSEKDRETLNAFSREEAVMLAYDIRLELSRAIMGHTKLTVEGFKLVKRIPITHSLTEDALINVVWEMEAITNSIISITERALHIHALKNKAPE